MEETSNTIKGTLSACVRHTSLQNGVHGGVEPWWLKGKPLVTKWKGQKYIHKKYFCQKYFHQKYFHQKYFPQKFVKNILTKNIFIKNIFTKNISEKIYKLFLKKNVLSKIFPKKYSTINILGKNIFTKNISEKTLLTTIFLKKGGGEAALLPAGPRLISSDSEISA